jgi:hypothetical protein
MKIIIIALLIATIVCNQGTLVDLNKMYEQGTLTNFLALLGDDADISVKDCGDGVNYPISITDSKVSPTKLVKGQDIQIKVKGVALEDTEVTNLHLDTLFNGSSIFKDDKPQSFGKVAAGGEVVYAYSASVPSFTPAGNWDITMNLQDSSKKNVSCLKVTFTTK